MGAKGHPTSTVLAKLDLWKHHQSVKNEFCSVNFRAAYFYYLMGDKIS